MAPTPAPAPAPAPGPAATGYDPAPAAASRPPSYVPPTPPPAMPAARLASDRTKDVVGVNLQEGAQVVYSVPVRDLQEGELLQVLAQLGITNDVVSERAESGSRVYGGENAYDVAMQGELIFADSPTAIDGMLLSKGDEYTVTPENHHGLYLQDGSLRVTPELAGRSGYINVVVDANVAGGTGPTETYNRERPNMIDLGGEPLLTVDEDHGGVDVIRTPQVPGGVPIDRAASSPVASEMLIDGPAEPSNVNPDSPHDKQVALSVPLGRVAAGELLAANASVHVRNLADLPTLAGGEIVLGDSPTDVSGQSIAEHHGTNLLGGEQDFRLAHHGAITSNRTHAAAYANYVLTSGASGSFENPGGSLQVLAGQGNLAVRRYG